MPACYHTFHISWIESWFRNNLSCPFCRQEITREGIDTMDHHRHSSIMKKVLSSLPGSMRIQTSDEEKWKENSKENPSRNLETIKEQLSNWASFGQLTGSGTSSRKMLHTQSHIWMTSQTDMEAIEEVKDSVGFNSWWPDPEIFAENLKDSYGGNPQNDGISSKRIHMSLKNQLKNTEL